MPDPQKVVLITGAAGGIGRAIVTKLATAGWAVLATDILPAEQAGFSTPGVHYRVLDVGDVDATAAAVGEAESLGSFQACIANAGLVGETFRPFVEAEPNEWERTFRVNVLGVLTTLQGAARSMVSHGGGRLLATASVSGIRSEPEIPAYSASKAAVIALVRSLAIELGPHGVTANAVAPGPTLTESQAEVIAVRRRASTEREHESSAEAFERRRNDGRPLGRLASPEDVADTYLWLLSDASRYVTGQAISVDGGGSLV